MKKLIMIMLGMFSLASAVAATYRVETTGEVNALKLGPGDRVIIAPGVHHETLAPNAVGTVHDPVVIEFAPGRHEFRADRATNLSYFVSNAADAPWKLRPIGMFVKECRHVRIEGGKKAEIWYGDRMTYVINDNSEDITYSGLTFDSVRPTVSELRVVDANTIQVAEGSTYQVDNGTFSWTGDMGEGGMLTQEADLAVGRCWRRGRFDPFAGHTVEDLGGGKIRFAGPHGLPVGHQFQFRRVGRDTTSFVNTRCGNITIRDCNFHSLPGMGIVSQFTEDITYERVNVVPRPGTIRTCAAWADVFHFSGCRGDILVDSCNVSGTQDDAVNVHGTHLRIVKKTGPNQVLLQFMHPQTYGFPAFIPGDEVAFINHQTLRGYASNTVAGLERKNDKVWLLTLTEPVADFGENDVVDNVSWYPNVIIRNCTVAMSSCRGFLITTRGKALVEGCTFLRTEMSAILVENDASGWFESGPIRDLTIRGNQFVQCARDRSPVVWINPHTRIQDPAMSVHENIRILDNVFDGGGIAAKGVKGLTITGNRFSAPSLPIKTNACNDVLIRDNATSGAGSPRATAMDGQNRMMHYNDQ